MVAIPTSQVTLYVDGKPVGTGEIRYSTKPQRFSNREPLELSDRAFTAEGSITFELECDYHAFVEDLLAGFFVIELSDLRAALAAALTRYRRPDIGPSRRTRYRRRVRRIARLLARAEAAQHPDIPDTKDFPQPGAPTPGSLQP